MRTIDLPVLRPVVARALSHPWRQIAWLWFLRFLRRDLPKPIIYPVAFLYSALHKVSWFWVLAWSVVSAAFAYNGMLGDAAKAAFCASMVPVLCCMLQSVIRAYRRVNR